MKLSKFIRDHQREIVDQWETFARTLLPAGGGLSRSALRDHAKEILVAIAHDLELPQAHSEQAEKSMGRGTKRRMEAVGKAHAALRIEDGFKLGQLVAEYRALRATVLRLFAEKAGAEKPSITDLSQVTRFNEALDEALVEATTRYMAVQDTTRDQFLAILGHDLRNPLGAILMSSALITSRGPEAPIAKASSRIYASADRMKRMVNDLLDLTRTRLGAGIPIAPLSMDLNALCHDVVAELQAFHPLCVLELQTEGDLRGTWDLDRLAQVLSNLIGNALQHGERGSPVGIVARGDAEGVVIKVHNQGRPIPRALLPNIFEPMVRDAGAQDEGSTSLGLGLHIAREVVLAHGGAVSVESTARAGTTFSVRLPRHSVAAAVSQEPAAGPDAHDSTGGLLVPGRAPGGLEGPSLH